MSLFRSGEPVDPGPVDPFGNAVDLATFAEAHARKTKSVDDILAASSQWLAIAQIHKILTEDADPQRVQQTGFTGGINNE